MKNVLREHMRAWYENCTLTHKHCQIQCIDMYNDTLINFHYRPIVTTRRGDDDRVVGQIEIRSIEKFLTDDGSQRHELPLLYNTGWFPTDAYCLRNRREKIPWSRMSFFNIAVFSKYHQKKRYKSEAVGRILENIYISKSVQPFWSCHSFLIYSKKT